MSTDPDEIEDQVPDTEEIETSNPFIETVSAYLGGGRGPLTAERLKYLGIGLKGAFTIGLLLGFVYWILIYFVGI